jgi:hypothetical protein
MSIKKFSKMTIFKKHMAPKKWIADNKTRKSTDLTLLKKSNNLYP